jgi:hypothetical protein
MLESAVASGSLGPSRDAPGTDPGDPLLMARRAGVFSRASGFVPCPSRDVRGGMVWQRSKQAGSAGPASAGIGELDYRRRRV